MSDTEDIQLSLMHAVRALSYSVIEVVESLHALCFFFFFSYLNFENIFILLKIQICVLLLLKRSLQARYLISILCLKVTHYHMSLLRRIAVPAPILTTQLILFTIFI